MSNLNRTGSNTPDYWQYSRLGLKTGVALGVAANSTATIPILSGGLTSNVGGNYIIRRVTVRNSSGSVAAANISISGPISGQITSTQGMAAISAVDMWLDMTLSASYVGAGNVTFNAGVNPLTTMLQDQFLNINVLAASAANNTVDVAVFGEVVIG